MKRRGEVSHTPYGPSGNSRTFRIKSFPNFGKEVAGHGCGAGYTNFTFDVIDERNIW